MAGSLQEHTVPFFKILPSKYNHRFLGRKRSRCRFRVHGTSCTCGCSSFWFWTMLCKGCYMNAFHEPVLFCNTSGALLFCEAQQPRPQRSSLMASGRELSRLSSSDSALASQAPTTCCRGRWVLVCNTDLVSAHSLGTSTPTSLLDTAVKTVIPHDLRENWTFVRYTAVPLKSWRIVSFRLRNDLSSLKLSMGSCLPALILRNVFDF